MTVPLSLVEFGLTETGFGVLARSSDLQAAQTKSPKGERRIELWGSRSIKLLLMKKNNKPAKFKNRSKNG